MQIVTKRSQIFRQDRERRWSVCWSKECESCTGLASPKDNANLESFLRFTHYHWTCKSVCSSSSTFTWAYRGTEKFLLGTKTFEKLKEKLINPPTLAYPDPDSIFILDTDASDRSIGAEFSQIQNGKNVVISYVSKILSSAQRKYCTSHKEWLAIVAFTRQYRHYLLGNQFIIRTDHNSLRWLLNFNNIEGQFS